ncbi:sigma 54-interacting transcriptional regulator [Dehalobacter sp. DCM]|uniref:sigma-54 interaction domain-containing protein n=1 Tax=Dehalobacter sp. DCM TaxID=2907827 RepID=UPI003081EC71|nr:sigma 54-interacting transcriptional regulator [Dehalobacter sp. DCM]
MQPLECETNLMLGKISYSSSESFNDVELMEKIRRMKEDLIRKHIRPNDINLVPKDVIESWVRSYKKGLDIRKPKRGPVLSDDELKIVLTEKEDLIEITRSYFQMVEPIFFNTSCTLLLSDENGVNLLDTYKDQRYISIGEIGTEDTVGTCAQSITLIKECPVQLFGPEHYFEDWSGAVASACPIFDFNHNLAGVLSVSSNCQDQSPRTLAFVMAMALAIQNKLYTEINNNLLNMSLDVSDKGMVILNQKGYITRTNTIAEDILNNQAKELYGNYYENIFGYQPVIRNLLQTGNPMRDLELMIERLNKRVQILSAEPIRSLGKTVGYVLFVKKIDRNKPINLLNNTETRYTFQKIIGNSPQMTQSLQTAKKISACNENILIEGESGTGKELFAQAIHHESGLGGPFVPLNCAAIPKTLIESELFGYEGGSFTGAERKGRIGKIEMANGGTLFLDEIGDMPLELQPVLLRVLEERNLMRVGGTRLIPVNFRLIAATNQNLLRLVENNLFRHDLFYRLAVLRMVIPPLKERDGDIKLLINYFLKKACSKQQVPIPTMSSAAEYQLINYDWPGNVRQLENAVIYALNMSSGDIIDYEDLPKEIQFRGVMPAKSTSNSCTSTDFASLKEIEKNAILETLLKNGNNIYDAARILGLSRTTLYRKIKEYDIVFNS